MRDPFGVHRRRVRSALQKRMQPGETIDAIARDEIARDYWVLTSREVLRLRQGVVAQHIRLSDALGAVTEQGVGVTVRVHSRQPADGQMLATFREHNELTRRLATVLQRPLSDGE
jgi:hypothetical protein